MTTASVLLDLPHTSMGEADELVRGWLAWSPTSLLAVPSRAGWDGLWSAVQTLVSRDASTPNALARRNAERVLEALRLHGLKPARVIVSGEGGLAFIFDGGSRYADVECLNDGSVLAGILDFEGESEVLELNLDDELRVGDVIGTLERFVDRG